MNEQNPEFVALERSNSDVVMKFDPNRSFSRKMDNLCEGDNKYLVAGVGNKQQFKAPESIPSKIKHSQIINQMVQEESEKCYGRGLPRIQEKDDENDDYPQLSRFEAFEDSMPLEFAQNSSNQYLPHMDLQKSSSAFADSNFFTKKQQHTFEHISNAPSKVKKLNFKQEEDFHLNEMALELEEMEN